MSEIVGKFSKCPCCGSERRFVQELADEVKAKGWMNILLNFCALFINGVVKDDDPAIERKIPIGSIVPAYGIGVDVCLDCGCIYAAELVRDKVKKTLPIKLNQSMIIKRN